MIFFVIAAIAFFASLYILRLPWDKSWARWSFCINIILICVILILFGLRYKMNITQAMASRRVIVAILDVSASTNFIMDDFKAIAENVWADYSLDVIPFSDQIRGAEGAEATGIVNSLKKIMPYISTQYEDEDMAGLVLITDGNETVNISELKEEATTTGKFPHNVIYLRSKNNSVKFDKSISFIKVPRFIPGYSKELISFSVSVMGAKLEGAPVELKLNGKNIGATFVHLESGYGEGEFELIVQRSGMNLLEASIAVDSRENITDNNRDYAVVEGIHKGFRVLHLSGHPSADTAFVRRGLQNIPGVDLISFFILRNKTQVNTTRDSELSLIPFPIDQLFRSELDNFDLIIVNDFRLKEFLSPYYIDNIVKFVKSGGGLLIMGGPESFVSEDYASNRFSSILPFSPAGGGAWDNRKFKIKPENISELTSLNGLKSINNLMFKGLNRIALKDWGNVFFRTSGGHPLIVGGIKGRARVLAVLSGSFWRFSYNAGLSNEAALKSMVRYVLGISSMPVGIFDNAVSFDRRFLSKKMKDVSARIQFINNDGSIQKEEMIDLQTSYNLQESDTRLINVAITQTGRILDKYQLLNYYEKKWDEHSYLPAGKEFLQNFAREGSGDFVIADREEISASLKDLSIRDPVVVSNKKEVENPIYMHKAVLLLFLYLVLSSFYLKSRFAG